MNKYFTFFAIVFVMAFQGTKVRAQSFRIDSLFDDRYHTNYVDYDTEDDDVPTCTGGDRVRVQRTIDLSSCVQSTDDPCRKCEIRRIRYDAAVAPCVEDDANFRERHEDSSALWLERCPCYPACSAAGQRAASVPLVFTACLGVIYFIYDGGNGAGVGY